MTLEGAARAFAAGCESMSRLNVNGARLMHKHGAHGATDVTGFGFLGHARNLAEHQAAPVSIELHTLPIVAGMLAVDAALSGNYRLALGLSAETSGGLLVALPSEAAAAAFIADIVAADGQPAWVVGRVVHGDRTARIVEGATLLEV